MTRATYIALLVMLVASCGGPKPTPPTPPPTPTPPPGAPPAPGAPGAPGAAGAPGASPEAPAPTQRAALELTDKDFVEGTNNRDPFRTFLREFNRPVRQISKQQRKVILPRYALDELKLIAVVTGGTRPRAMFRDPSGLGVSVKRGDYISKNAGKVKQILTDKVVVEIEEQAEDKNTLVDRVIDLHPKEAQEAEGSEGQTREEPDRSDKLDKKAPPPAAEKAVPKQ
jgi:Tfp pilus assembly protein PilP